MSIFDAAFASDVVPSLKDAFGRSVTLTGPSVSNLAITAVRIARGIGSEESGETGQQDVETWTLTVADADVSAPGDYDEVIVGSDTWSLEQPPQRTNESLITYQMRRKVQAERTLPGYRRS